jgi:hypothetical protein
LAKAKEELIMLKTLMTAVTVTVLLTQSAIPASAKAARGDDLSNICLATPEQVHLSLEGGVQMNHLNEGMFRAVVADLKQVEKGAKKLHALATIVPVRIITEPEFINGVVIGLPVGTEPIGPPRPLRQADVQSAMSHLTPVVDAMKQDADGKLSNPQRLDLPESVTSNIQPDLEKWVAMVDELAAHEKQLESLTSGSQYDNDAIADTTTNIEQDAKQLEKVAHRIDHVLIKNAGPIAAFQISREM